MSNMAIGYGSEFHLLRFMGRHRKDLDKAIIKALDMKANITWLDFPYNYKTKKYDNEYVGINFLDEKKYKDLKGEWEIFWPNKSRTMNWDAVGKIGNHWLLIEAKAHVEELMSSSGASKESQAVIRDRFCELGKKRGIDIKSDWMKTYYQKANRLLFLHFLQSQGIKVKMVFIYFVNGYETEKKNVKTVQEWKAAIKIQDDYLGISANKWVKEHVVNVFIDTRNNRL